MMAHARIHRAGVERTGWLLDLYEDPLGGVVVWFLDDSGERRRLRQRFPVTFYAAGPAARLQALEQFVARCSPPAAPRPPRTWHCRRADVFARREVDVCAVEVARPADLPDLFRAVSRRFPDLDYADADLPLSLRYAAATGVSPLCRCRLIVDGLDRILSAEPLEDPWQLDPSPIPLRVMTLEPDDDPAHSSPGWLYVRVEDEDCRLSLRSPRALLVNLQALLVRHDPDLLLATWGDTWLMPRLMEWSERCGIPLSLNRDPDAVTARRKERWYFSYGQLVYRGEQVHLFGRWHIDRRNAMLWSEYELDGVLETARVTALPLQTAARVSPGTGISAIQVLAALRHNILVPWQKQQAELPKPASDLFTADQGGLVYQPILGVHKDVVAIDFISMYPAIITCFNLSPETIDVEAPTQPSGSEELAGLLEPPGSVRVPELNLRIRRVQPGIVPLALKPLLEKRVGLKLRQADLPAWDARRAVDQRRSSALKWLLVTCFGYLGYKNARFGRIEAHQAVTAYGREALLLAKEAAEDAGGEVLHAYVDSLFVRWDHLPAPDELRALLDDIYARTRLPIALDGIYRWVVFLPSKVNRKRPVPNRYFGVFQNGEIKARGIAARRHDTPPWIARVQMELIQLLAGCPQPEAALPAAWQRVQRELADLCSARIPLEQLLLAQRISRELEDYRAPSPAARAAAQLTAAGKLVKPGQRVRFLYTLGDPGVYAWNLPERPSPARVDVPRYRELLERAAREVLDPFAEPESGQKELFQLSSHLDWLYDQAQDSHLSVEPFSCLSPSF